MRKTVIEHPKVFISYAWGSQEFQSKVLAFATDLMSDGVDVIFDKWELKEGNDTYAFMERSVTDKSIDNVLILLSPEYEKKANDRSGGVGTETQIISPEVYNKISQDKFLPIVFARGENGEVPKPTYLKTLLYFDLSNAESYDKEYRRLVKRLNGIEVVKKPELGNKPEWLETELSVGAKIITSYDVLKSSVSDAYKTELLESFLFDLKTKIIEFKNEDGARDALSCEAYILLYDETKVVRDEFLLLMRYISNVINGEKLVATKLEELCNEVKNTNTLYSNVQKTFLHELFIYIVAIFYKSKNYAALSYILTRTYFVNRYHADNAQSYNVFYNNDEHLDKAICQRDNKKYHSGQAQYWIDNINTDICNKNEFAFADVLCYNAANLIENYTESWKWFPVTYPYDKTTQSYAVKLKSKERLCELAAICGYKDVELFKKKYKEIEDLVKKGYLNEYRYSGSFDSAPLLCNFIKTEELGIRN